MNYLKDRPIVPATAINKLVLYNPEQIDLNTNRVNEAEEAGPIYDFRFVNTDSKYMLSVSENCADCSQPSQQESSIRVVVVEPWTPPKVMWITNTLNAKQRIVGGLIEVVCPFTEPVAIIVNEEGKLIGLPLNRKFGNDIFAGTFIICGLDEQNACFASLSEEQVKYYTNMFGTIEIYLDPASLNGKT